jgi:hypothetical protein
MTRRNATAAGCVLVAFVFIAVAVFAVRPAATPGPLLRDFEAYWSAGMTIDGGHDPYSRAIWRAERTVPGVDAARDELLPFVSPPPVLPLWMLAGRLPYVWAARVWWIALAASLIALAWLSLRRSCGTVAPVALLAAFALAIGFGPVTSDLALGQIALVAVLGAALLTAAPFVWQTAGVFAAVLQPNVALGALSQLGRPRTAIAAATGALLAYGSGALALGWRWPVDYLALLQAHAGAERWSAIQITPAAVAWGFGLPPPSVTAIAGFSLVAAVVAGILLWRAIADPFARFAATSLLAPFVAGFFHEQDFVVAYAAAVWCAVRTSGRTRAIAQVATLLVSIDWLGLAQRPTGIVQSALLAGAALCAFAALGSRVIAWQDAAAAAPVALAFAAAAALGALHPLPVWPDTLGAFHAPASWTASTVWLHEQAAAGLLAVNPVWALLRVPPLLGCALLAAVIYRDSSRCRTGS